MFLNNKMIIPSLMSGLEGKEAVPAIALVPTASFKRENLTTKNPNLGYVPENQIYKPAMMNETTSISTARRVIMCRNDLRVKVGRPAKDKFKLHQTSGVGRKTNDIFPRERPNNLPLHITTDSQSIFTLNKLGVPK
jgi:hypothetical protein